MTFENAFTNFATTYGQIIDDLLKQEKSAQSEEEKAEIESQLRMLIDVYGPILDRLAAKKRAKPFAMMPPPEEQLMYKLAMEALSDYNKSFQAARAEVESADQVTSDMIRAKMTGDLGRFMDYAARLWKNENAGFGPRGNLYANRLANARTRDEIYMVYHQINRDKKLDAEEKDALIERIGLLFEAIDLPWNREVANETADTSNNTTETAADNEMKERAPLAGQIAQAQKNKNEWQRKFDEANRAQADNQLADNRNARKIAQENKKSIRSKLDKARSELKTAKEKAKKAKNKDQNAINELTEQIADLERQFKAVEDEIKILEDKIKAALNMKKTIKHSLDNANAHLEALLKKSQEQKEESATQPEIVEPAPLMPRSPGDFSVAQKRAYAEIMEEFGPNLGARILKTLAAYNGDLNALTGFDVLTIGEILARNGLSLSDKQLITDLAAAAEAGFTVDINTLPAISGRPIFTPPPVNDVSQAAQSNTPSVDQAGGTQSSSDATEYLNKLTESVENMNSGASSETEALGSMIMTILSLFISFAGLTDIDQLKTAVIDHLSGLNLSIKQLNQLIAITNVAAAAAQRMKELKEMIKITTAVKDIPAILDAIAKAMKNGEIPESLREAFLKTIYLSIFDLAEKQDDIRELRQMIIRNMSDMLGGGLIDPATANALTAFVNNSAITASSKDSLSENVDKRNRQRQTNGSVFENFSTRYGALMDALLKKISDPSSSDQEKALAEKQLKALMTKFGSVLHALGAAANRAPDTVLNDQDLEQVQALYLTLARFENFISKGLSASVRSIYNAMLKEFGSGRAAAIIDVLMKMIREGKDLQTLTGFDILTIQHILEQGGFDFKDPAILQKLQDLKNALDFGIAVITPGMELETSFVPIQPALNTPPAAANVQPNPELYAELEHRIDASGSERTLNMCMSEILTAWKNGQIGENQAKALIDKFIRAKLVLLGDMWGLSSLTSDFDALGAIGVISEADMMDLRRRAYAYSSDIARHGNSTKFKEKLKRGPPSEKVSPAEIGAQKDLEEEQKADKTPQTALISGTLVFKEKDPPGKNKYEFNYGGKVSEVTDDDLAHAGITTPALGKPQSLTATQSSALSVAQNRTQVVAQAVSDGNGGFTVTPSDGNTSLEVSPVIAQKLGISAGDVTRGLLSKIRWEVRQNEVVGKAAFSADGKTCIIEMDADGTTFEVSESSLKTAGAILRGLWARITGKNNAGPVQLTAAQVIAALKAEIARLNAIGKSAISKKGDIPVVQQGAALLTRAAKYEEAVREIKFDTTNPEDKATMAAEFAEAYLNGEEFLTNFKIEFDRILADKDLSDQEKATQMKTLLNSFTQSDDINRTGTNNTTQYLVSETRDTINRLSASIDNGNFDSAIIKELEKELDSLFSAISIDLYAHMMNVQASLGLAQKYEALDKRKNDISQRAAGHFKAEDERVKLKKYFQTADIADLIERIRNTTDQEEKTKLISELAEITLRQHFGKERGTLSTTEALVFSEIMFSTLTEKHYSLRSLQRQYIEGLVEAKAVLLSTSGGKTISNIIAAGIMALTWDPKDHNGRTYSTVIITESERGNQNYLGEAKGTGLHHQNIAAFFGLKMVNGSEMLKSRMYKELAEAFEQPDTIVILDPTQTGFLNLNKFEDPRLFKAVNAISHIIIDEIDKLAVSQQRFIMAGLMPGANSKEILEEYRVAGEILHRLIDENLSKVDLEGLKNEDAKHDEVWNEAKKIVAEEENKSWKKYTDDVRNALIEKKFFDLMDEKGLLPKEEKKFAFYRQDIGGGVFNGYCSKSAREYLKREMEKELTKTYGNLEKYQRKVGDQKMRIFEDYFIDYAISSGIRAAVSIYGQDFASGDKLLSPVEGRGSKSDTQFSDPVYCVMLALKTNKLMKDIVARIEHGESPSDIASDFKISDEAFTSSDKQKWDDLLNKDDELSKEFEGVDSSVRLDKDGNPLGLLNRITAVQNRMKAITERGKELKKLLRLPESKLKSNEGGISHNDLLTEAKALENEIQILKNKQLILNEKKASYERVFNIRSAELAYILAVNDYNDGKITKEALIAAAQAVCDARNIDITKLEVNFTQSQTTLLALIMDNNRARTRHLENLPDDERVAAEAKIEKLFVCGGTGTAGLVAPIISNMFNTEVVALDESIFEWDNYEECDEANVLTGLRKIFGKKRWQEGGLVIKTKDPGLVAAEGLPENIKAISDEDKHAVLAYFDDKSHMNATQLKLEKLIGKNSSIVASGSEAQEKLVRRIGQEVLVIESSTGNSVSTEVVDAAGKLSVRFENGTTCRLGDNGEVYDAGGKQIGVVDKTSTRQILIVDENTDANLINTVARHAAIFGDIILSYNSDILVGTDCVGKFVEIGFGVDKLDKNRFLQFKGRTGRLSGAGIPNQTARAFYIFENDVTEKLNELYDSSSYEDYERVLESDPKALELMRRYVAGMKLNTVELLYLVTTLRMADSIGGVSLQKMSEVMLEAGINGPVKADIMRMGTDEQGKPITPVGKKMEQLYTDFLNHKLGRSQSDPTYHEAVSSGSGKVASTAEQNIAQVEDFWARVVNELNDLLSSTRLTDGDRKSANDEISKAKKILQDCQKAREVLKNKEVENYKAIPLGQVNNFFDAVISSMRLLGRNAVSTRGQTPESKTTSVQTKTPSTMAALRDNLENETPTGVSLNDGTSVAIESENGKVTSSADTSKIPEGSTIDGEHVLNSTGQDIGTIENTADADGKDAMNETYRSGITIVQVVDDSGKQLGGVSVRIDENGIVLDSSDESLVPVGSIVAHDGTVTDPTTTPEAPRRIGISSTISLATPATDNLTREGKNFWTLVDALRNLSRSDAKALSRMFKTGFPPEDKIPLAFAIKLASMLVAAGLENLTELSDSPGKNGVKTAVLLQRCGLFRLLTSDGKVRLTPAVLSKIAKSDDPEMEIWKFLLEDNNLSTEGESVLTALRADFLDIIRARNKAYEAIQNRKTAAAFNNILLRTRYQDLVNKSASKKFIRNAKNAIALNQKELIKDLSKLDLTLKGKAAVYNSNAQRGGFKGIVFYKPLAYLYSKISELRGTASQFGYNNSELGTLLRFALPLQDEIQALPPQAMSPDDISDQLAIADTALQQGDAAAAKSQVETILAVDPYNAHAIELYVKIIETIADNENEKKETSTITFGGQAGGISPKAITHKVNTNKKDLYELALEYARAALALDPGNKSIRMRIAQLLKKTGDLKGALKEARLALQDRNVRRNIDFVLFAKNLAEKSNETKLAIEYSARALKLAQKAADGSVIKTDQVIFLNSELSRLNALTAKKTETETPEEKTKLEKIVDQFKTLYGFAYLKDMSLSKKILTVAGVVCATILAGITIMLGIKVIAGFVSVTTIISVLVSIFTGLDMRTQKPPEEESLESLMAKYRQQSQPLPSSSVKKLFSTAGNKIKQLVEANLTSPFQRRIGDILVKALPIGMAVSAVLILSVSILAVIGAAPLYIGVFSAIPIIGEAIMQFSAGISLLYLITRASPELYNKIFARNTRDAAFKNLRDIADNPFGNTLSRVNALDAMSRLDDEDKRGGYIKSISDLMKTLAAAELSADDAAVCYLKLAALCIEADQPDSAVENLEKLQSRLTNTDVNNADILRMLSDVRSKKKDNDGALLNVLLAYAVRKGGERDAIITLFTRINKLIAKKDYTAIAGLLDGSFNASEEKDMEDLKTILSMLNAMQQGAAADFIVNMLIQHDVLDEKLLPIAVDQLLLSGKYQAAATIFSLAITADPANSQVLELLKKISGKAEFMDDPDRNAVLAGLINAMRHCSNVETVKKIASAILDSFHAKNVSETTNYSAVINAFVLSARLNTFQKINLIMWINDRFAGATTKALSDDEHLLVKSAYENALQAASDVRVKGMLEIGLAVTDMKLFTKNGQDSALGHIESAEKYLIDSGVAQKYLMRMKEIEADICELSPLTVIADDLFNAGEYGKAEKLLKTAVKQHPEDWNAHYLLGQIAMKKKDYAGARTSYEQALKLNPALKENIRTDLVNIFIELNLPNEAVAALDGKDPPDATKKPLLDILLKNLKEIDQSLDAQKDGSRDLDFLDRATKLNDAFLRLNPGDSEAAKRANTLSDLTKAITEKRSKIVLSSWTFALDLESSRTSMQADVSRQAAATFLLKIYGKLMTLMKPDDARRPHVYARMMILLLENGDIDTAFQHYQNALLQNVRCSSADMADMLASAAKCIADLSARKIPAADKRMNNYRIAMLYQISGDTGKANVLYSRAKDGASDSLKNRIDSNIAFMLYASGDHKAALSAARQIDAPDKNTGELIKLIENEGMPPTPQTPKLFASVADERKLWESDGIAVIDIRLKNMERAYGALKIARYYAYGDDTKQTDLQKRLTGMEIALGEIYLEKAFSLAPNTPEIAANIENSRVLFKKAMQSDPKIAAVYAGLAKISLLKGDSGVFNTDLFQASTNGVDIKEEFGYSLKSRAVALLTEEMLKRISDGNYQAAKWVYDRLVIVSNDDALAHIEDLITILTAMINVAEKVKKLSKSQRMNLARLYLELADVYEKNVDSVNAKEARNTAYSYNKKDTNTLFWAGQAALEANKFKRAVKCFTAAMKDESLRQKAAEALLDAYIQSSDTDHAFALYRSDALDKEAKDRLKNDLHQLVFKSARSLSSSARIKPLSKAVEIYEFLIEDGFDDTALKSEYFIASVKYAEKLFAKKAHGDAEKILARLISENKKYALTTANMEEIYQKYRSFLTKTKDISEKNMLYNDLLGAYVTIGESTQDERVRKTMYQNALDTYNAARGDIGDDFILNKAMKDKFLSAISKIGQFMIALKIDKNCPEANLARAERFKNAASRAKRNKKMPKFRKLREEAIKSYEAAAKGTGETRIRAAHELIKYYLHTDVQKALTIIDSLGDELDLRVIEGLNVEKIALLLSLAQAKEPLVKKKKDELASAGKIHADLAGPSPRTALRDKKIKTIITGIDDLEREIASLDIALEAQRHNRDESRRITSERTVLQNELIALYKKLDNSDPQLGRLLSDMRNLENEIEKFEYDRLIHQRMLQDALSGTKPLSKLKITEIETELAKINKEIEKRKDSLLKMHVELDRIQILTQRKDRYVAILNIEQKIANLERELTSLEYARNTARDALLAGIAKEAGSDEIERLGSELVRCNKETRNLQRKIADAYSQMNVFRSGEQRERIRINFLKMYAGLRNLDREIDSLKLASLTGKRDVRSDLAELRKKHDDLLIKLAHAKIFERRKAVHMNLLTQAPELSEIDTINAGIADIVSKIEATNETLKTPGLTKTQKRRITAEIARLTGTLNTMKARLSLIRQKLDEVKEKNYPKTAVVSIEERTASEERKAHEDIATSIANLDREIASLELGLTMQTEKLLQKAGYPAGKAQQVKDRLRLSEELDALKKERKALQDKLAAMPPPRNEKTIHDDLLDEATHHENNAADMSKQLELVDQDMKTIGGKETAEILLKQANIYMAHGDEETAKKFARRIVALRDTENVTSVQLARAYQILGDLYAALEESPDDVDIAMSIVKKDREELPKVLKIVSDALNRTSPKNTAFMSGMRTRLENAINRLISFAVWSGFIDDTSFAEGEHKISSDKITEVFDILAGMIKTSNNAQFVKSIMMILNNVGEKERIDALCRSMNENPNFGTDGFRQTVEELTEKSEYYAKQFQSQKNVQRPSGVIRKKATASFAPVELLTGTASVMVAVLIAIKFGLIIGLAAAIGIIGIAGIALYAVSGIKTAPVMPKRIPAAGTHPPIVGLTVSPEELKSSGLSERFPDVNFVTVKDKNHLENTVSEIGARSAVFTDMNLADVNMNITNIVRQARLQALFINHPYLANLSRTAIAKMTDKEKRITIALLVPNETRPTDILGDLVDAAYGSMGSSDLAESSSADDNILSEATETLRESDMDTVQRVLDTDLNDVFAGLSPAAVESKLSLMENIAIENAAARMLHDYVRADMIPKTHGIALDLRGKTGFDADLMAESIERLSEKDADLHILAMIDSSSKSEAISRLAANYKKNFHAIECEPDTDPVAILESKLAELRGEGVILDITAVSIATNAAMQVKNSSGDEISMTDNVISHISDDAEKANFVLVDMPDDQGERDRINHLIPVLTLLNLLKTVSMGNKVPAITTVACDENIISRLESGLEKILKVLYHISRINISEDVAEYVTSLESAEKSL